MQPTIVYTCREWPGVANKKCVFSSAALGMRQEDGSVLCKLLSIATYI